MGFTIPPESEIYSLLYRSKTKERTSDRVALWQIPYDNRYREFDTDNSSWFESVNKHGENEIENAETNLMKSFRRYKVHTTTTEYDDNTVEETSVYPNGTQVNVSKGINHVYVAIKNKFNQLVAEKLYGRDSDDGRKTIFKYIKQGDNTFTIVKIYSYKTTKNKATDIINYGYTSDEATLTKGCNPEKEYYMLNGKETEAEKISDTEYRVTDINGNVLTFKAELN